MAISDTKWSKFRINEPFINTKRPAGSFHHVVGAGFICVAGVSASQSWALVPSALSCPPCGLGAPGLVSKPLVTTAPLSQASRRVRRRVHTSDPSSCDLRLRDSPGQRAPPACLSPGPAEGSELQKGLLVSLKAQPRLYWFLQGDDLQDHFSVLGLNVTYDHSGGRSSSFWSRTPQSGCRRFCSLWRVEGRVPPCILQIRGLQALLACGCIVQSLPLSSRGLPFPCVSSVFESKDSCHYETL